MERKPTSKETAVTVLLEKRTKNARYVLAEFCLWRSKERVIYAEKSEDAACVLLPQELYMEAEALLDRIAWGDLSPLHLKDVVEDAIGMLNGGFFAKNS